MYLFIESIQILNRKPVNIECHTLRFNITRNEFFGCKQIVDLEQFIQIPIDLDANKYKCRIVYGETIEHVEFLPYSARTVSSLKMVHSNTIDYSFKYENRRQIDELLKEKGNADDILIVKNGEITDTSCGNVLFWDGDQWYTPANPLLFGTQLMKLTADGTVIPQIIKPIDLQRFRKLRIVNAMLNFENEVDVAVSDII